VPNLPSWKAKKLRKLPQEKVLLELEGGWPTVTHEPGLSALVPFAADQSVFYIKQLFVSRISPGERGALLTLLKPLQELDKW
jgi:hypothetical protein